MRPVAERLNTARLGSAIEEFIAGCLTTDEVVRLLPTVTTRQAVHRLRERGRLVGRTVGNATWFPAWQFDGDGLRADLPDLLSRLCRFTTDTVAADRVMRTPRDELGGATLAEALDDPAHRPLAILLLDQLGAGH